ncbi:MAG: hypothetical protein AVDCRST_MAG56-3624 [uncultured Cytophagales bacterium]|uniref:Uncharacterized protein n=1 Tax=uncultured Cytophagales bacterium TaxID=158755 RepID=A0A6J4JIV3_9SPHI|nr:MAG: hypothetical protein AVDCRST_MAG56-3624 [uncultured Cytophagales bacterium]
MPVACGAALLLGVQVGQVPNVFPFAQHLVEKVNEQVLVELRAEETLEAKVGKRIDVFFFAIIR